MSQENVEIVREAARCFERGDWERLRSLATPDASMTPLENWPEPGPFVGLAESIREYQRLTESFENSRMTITECSERGDWVVARYRWVSEGTGSGAPAEVSFSGVHRLVGGEIAESHYRFDHNAALEAAGLSE